MKSVVFIGHDDCYGVNYDALKEKIEECIKNGAKYFYSGGYGGFDRLTATLIYKFKDKYKDIKNYLIIPYQQFTVFDKALFDEIVFPEILLNCHFKGAIVKRNRFMVDECDTAICFINHGWGNAVKTYEYAVRKKLNIINLGKHNI